MRDKKSAFDSSDARQASYQREARLQYDQALYQESQANWNSYSQAQQDFIKKQGDAIYSALGEAIAAGKGHDHADVQALLRDWHDHLRHFYEPTLDLLRGLGQLYNSDDRFQANFAKIHPQLPAFLETAIANYVDDLETAAIEQMLDEDEAQARAHKRLSS